MGIFASLVGYRTIAFNAIMLVLAFAKQKGYIAAVPDSSVINQFLDVLLNNMPEIITAGNIVLRCLTTTPVGKKPS